MFVRCVKIPYKDSICQNCYYLRQKDDSSIQDDLILSFDGGYMSNSETISFFLKLTATERVSIFHFDLLINNLDCISLQMRRRIPPLFPFLSYR